MKKLQAAIAAAVCALLLVQTAYAAPAVDIYAPITVDNTVTFEAGEAQGSFDGESHTEGASNQQDTTTSLNNNIANAASREWQRIVETAEQTGELIIQEDTYVINTYTMTIPKYELIDFVITLLGYDTVTQIIPIEYFELYPAEPPILTEALDEIVLPTDNIEQAMQQIIEQVMQGGGMSASSVPSFTGGGGGGIGGGDPSTGSGLTGMGDPITIGMIIAELINTYGEAIIDSWSEELLYEFQLPIYDITGGEIIMQPDGVTLDYQRTDIIPGGIIDTRSLEARYALLDMYLNHVSMSESVDVTCITEHRITSETQSMVIQNVPTNTWVWTVEDGAGNVVAGPIYTQGKYLRFIFQSAGTYRIRASQVMNVVRADVVTYDRNEYWVLNNGDAFDGLVVYRNRQTGMGYNTNVTQAMEEVPVSAFEQLVTADMVGNAYIAGPGNGLVGAPTSFDTQRYR